MSKKFEIGEAVECLRDGGVIAYPTEAVWGLGCDPFNPDAVNRLLALKKRSKNKGLILAAGSISQVEVLMRALSYEQQELVVSKWPGPVTWIIPDALNIIPNWIKGQHSKVAVRVSSHSVVKDLSNAFRGMIVSTSANLNNESEIKSFEVLERQFGSKLDGIVEGDLGLDTNTSEIWDVETGIRIR